MLTRKELATLLNVHERTIDNYRKKGMPFIKVVKAVRFDEIAVLKWIKENEVK